MATIGTFNPTKSGGYEGTIVLVSSIQNTRLVSFKNMDIIAHQ